MGSLFGGSGGQSQQQSQQQTQNQAQSQSTRYSPEYEAYVNNVLGRSTATADKPWQGYDVSKMFAGFTPDQEQAFSQIRGFQGAYQPYFDQAKGALNNVAGYDPRGAAQPYLDRAGSAINPWQAGAGMTADSSRGWNDPGVQAGYMNPYTEGAINRAADISNRNFMEKTMPGISSQFAKSTGALGRDNYAKFTGQAVRDLAGEQAGTAASMMDQAYWKAATQYGTDAARKMQAAGQLGALSRSAIDADTNLAKTNADITSGAVNTGINVANAYSTQAGALSNLNLMNTAALQQAGNQQQQQNQLPLTAQYQQWQQQQGYDWDTIAKMNAAQRGLSIPTTQSGTSTSQTQTTGGSTSGSSSQPSVAGSVLGTLSSANTLFGKGNVGGLERGYNALFGDGTATVGSPGGFDLAGTGAYGMGAARGGRIPTPRYYRGGAVSRYGHGGPVFASPQHYDGVRRYAVGGAVPVMRGLQGRGMPPMPSPGMGGPPGALPPGPFSGGGALPFPMPPMPGGPPPGPPPGALGMMR